MQMQKSWIFTQPHKTYYNRHHYPILQFTSVLWNPFSVVFVMIMFPFVIYKALLLKPLVVAQFLGGPLLPHLLQTPEIRKLLFVPLIRIIILKNLIRIIILKENLIRIIILKHLIRITILKKSLCSSYSQNNSQNISFSLLFA